MLSFLTDLLGFTQPRSGAAGAISLFLAGASIPAAAAATYGGGENLVPGQRWAEAEIRAYIRSLEDEIEELRRALDACEQQ